MTSMMDRTITQAEFAELVGLSEARVSQLKAEGLLKEGATGAAWLLAYCDRLREAAAGRQSLAGGALDLVQERAALARSQRLGHDIKNEIALKTYAPITLLAHTLALASQAVVDRLEQLPGDLKKSCPELPQTARERVMATIAAARNEWVNRTVALLSVELDPEGEENEDAVPAADAADQDA